MAKLTGKSSFSPTALSLELNNVYEADKTAQVIRERISPEFKVIEWQEANRPLFAALSLERKVVLAIIALIIFIAALNITTTLALLVNEHRLDIAVLRTSGASTKSLVMIFLFEGLILGTMGVILGILAGIIACFLINHFRLINLPSEVYSISYISLHPLFWEIAVIALSTLCISLLATLYPAWQAARIKPLENLRIS
jgi:lipoprotein-releasing system permease protein